MRKGKILFVGLLGLLLAFGMAVVGCDDSDPYSSPKGGTLTVINTSADEYDVVFFDPVGDRLSQRMLMAYREVTFSGTVDGVYEIRYSLLMQSKWSSKYGSLSGGRKATVNIP